MNKKEIFQDIFVYENFLKKEQCESVINFINQNSNLAIFGKTKKRQGIPLGSIPFIGTIDSKHIQEKIKLKNFPDEIQFIIKDLSKKVIEEIQQNYKDNEDMHVSNIIFAKQYRGGKVVRHRDSDPWDMHLEYSAVLYLNEIEYGELLFPEKNVSHHPKSGDLVMYKSKDPTSSHEVLNIDSDRYSLPMWISKDLNAYVE